MSNDDTRDLPGGAPPPPERSELANRAEREREHERRRDPASEALRELREERRLRPHPIFGEPMRCSVTNTVGYSVKTGGNIAIDKHGVKGEVGAPVRVDLLRDPEAARPLPLQIYAEKHRRARIGKA